MYVRPLNEKSNLEFLRVRTQLREIFFSSKSKPFLPDGPNTPFGVMASSLGVLLK